MHNPDRLGSDGRLVAVEGMRYDVAVLDCCLGGPDGFAIELDGAFSDRFGVVFRCAVAEFVAEDVEDFSAPPSLLTPLFGVLVLALRVYERCHLLRAVWYVKWYGATLMMH